MMLTGMTPLVDSEAVVSRWTLEAGSEIASGVDLRSQLVLVLGGFEDWKFEMVEAVRDRHSINHPGRHHAVAVVQAPGHKDYCIVGATLG
jgi:hypothetical protein